MEEATSAAAAVAAAGEGEDAAAALTHDTAVGTSDDPPLLPDVSPDLISAWAWEEGFGGGPGDACLLLSTSSGRLHRVTLSRSADGSGGGAAAAAAGGSGGASAACGSGALGSREETPPQPAKRPPGPPVLGGPPPMSPRLRGQNPHRTLAAAVAAFALASHPIIIDDDVSSSGSGALRAPAPAGAADAGAGDAPPALLAAHSALEHTAGNVPATSLLSLPGGRVVYAEEEGDVLVMDLPPLAPRCAANADGGGAGGGGGGSAAGGSSIADGDASGDDSAASTAGGGGGGGGGRAAVRVCADLPQVYAMLDVVAADLMGEGEPQYYTSTVHAGCQAVKPSALVHVAGATGPDYPGLTGMWSLLLEGGGGGGGGEAAGGGGAPPEPTALVVLSFPGATRALLSRGTLTEGGGGGGGGEAAGAEGGGGGTLRDVTADVGLQSAQQTLACGLLAPGLLLQACSRELRLCCVPADGGAVGGPARAPPRERRSAGVGSASASASAAASGSSNSPETSMGDALSPPAPVPPRPGSRQWRMPGPAAAGAAAPPSPSLLPHRPSTPPASGACGLVLAEQQEGCACYRLPPGDGVVLAAVAPGWLALLAAAPRRLAVLRPVEAHGGGAAGGAGAGRRKRGRGEWRLQGLAELPVPAAQLSCLAISGAVGCGGDAAGAPRAWLLAGDYEGGVSLFSLRGDGGALRLHADARFGPRQLAPGPWVDEPAPPGAAGGASPPGPRRLGAAAPVPESLLAIRPPDAVAAAGAPAPPPPPGLHFLAGFRDGGLGLYAWCARRQRLSALSHMSTGASPVALVPLPLVPSPDESGAAAAATAAAAAAAAGACTHAVAVGEAVLKLSVSRLSRRLLAQRWALRGATHLAPVHFMRGDDEEGGPQRDVGQEEEAGEDGEPPGGRNASAAFVEVLAADAEGRLTAAACGLVAPVTRHMLLALPRCSRLAVHPRHGALLHLCCIQDDNAPGVLLASDPRAGRVLTRFDGAPFEVFAALCTWAVAAGHASPAPAPAPPAAPAPHDMWGPPGAVPWPPAGWADAPAAGAAGGDSPRGGGGGAKPATRAPSSAGSEEAMEAEGAGAGGAGAVPRPRAILVVVGSEIISTGSSCFGHIHLLDLRPVDGGGGTSSGGSADGGAAAAWELHRVTTLRLPSEVGALAPYDDRRLMASVGPRLVCLRLRRGRLEKRGWISTREPCSAISACAQRRLVAAADKQHSVALFSYSEDGPRGFGALAVVGSDVVARPIADVRLWRALPEGCVLALDADGQLLQLQAPSSAPGGQAPPVRNLATTAAFALGGAALHFASDACDGGDAGDSVLHVGTLLGGIHAILAVPDAADAHLLRCLQAALERHAATAPLSGRPRVPRRVGGAAAGPAWEQLPDGGPAGEAAPEGAGAPLDGDMLLQLVDAPRGVQESVIGGAELAARLRARPALAAKWLPPASDAAPAAGPGGPPVDGVMNLLQRLLAGSALL